MEYLKRNKLFHLLKIIFFNFEEDVYNQIAESIVFLWDEGIR